MSPTPPISPAQGKYSAGSNAVLPTSMYGTVSLARKYVAIIGTRAMRAIPAASK